MTVPFDCCECVPVIENVDHVNLWEDMIQIPAQLLASTGGTDPGTAKQPLLKMSAGIQFL